VSPHFRPSEILRFAWVMDLGSTRPLKPSDGCRSTIYPIINPYRVSGPYMVSFGGLFGVVLCHGCHDPSLVHFFQSNYPILTHFCLLVSFQTLQNIRV
jgi:hypothetical protein